MSKTNLKVILLGNKASGKTSIINQYINKEFSYEYFMTIGQDKLIKTIIVDNIKLTLNIWDTAGQEKFAEVNKIFMKNSDIIILVYDITNKNSFESLNKWYEEIKNHINIDNVIICVAANKSDLYTEEEVSLDTAKEYCNTINSLLIETTAIDYDSINNLFNTIVMEYYNKFIKINENEIKNKKDNGNYNKDENENDNEYEKKEQISLSSINSKIKDEKNNYKKNTCC